VVAAEDDEKSEMRWKRIFDNKERWNSGRDTQSEYLTNTNTPLLSVMASLSDANITLTRTITGATNISYTRTINNYTVRFVVEEYVQAHNSGLRIRSIEEVPPKTYGSFSIAF